jgi:hypothetical protein
VQATKCRSAIVERCSRRDALREERVPVLRIGVTAMRELLLECGDVHFYGIATLSAAVAAAGGREG